VSDPAAVFLQTRGEQLATGDRSALAAVLETTIAAAREAWPGVNADLDSWITALAELAPKPFDAERPLGAVMATDHFLAFACADGDPAAVAACDAILVREAGFAAEGTRMHASVRDEATQVAREHLFARRADKPPAIKNYSGRGPLRAWLRVIVSRELVRLAKTQQKSSPLEERLIASPIVVEDPVLEELKTKYRAQLAEAFRSALATLTARDRTLLRYQVIDGLTIDDIGALFKVHRATAARWIAKIREDLVEHTRATMAEALGVDTAEAASIVRLVQSQLDVSVIRHLETKSE
jgi:RNA polymerase sigma-70 factor, ECF subfamily